jgi:hypothetical protein
MRDSMHLSASHCNSEAPFCLRVVHEGGGADVLTGQQGHSARHQHHSDPAPAIHFLVEEDFRGEGIADEGKRGRRRGNEADVIPGKRKQKAEKSDGHSCDAETKVSVAESAANNGPQPTAAPERMNVANLLHRPGQQDVADH